MQKLNQLNSRVKSQKQPLLFSQVNQKNDSDIVIVSALRTPLTKARTGGLNNTKPEEMLAHVLKAVIQDTKISAKEIEDVAVGNVLLPGGGTMVFRTAQFLADYPINVPIYSVGRFCSSGLEAVSLIASKIKSGVIECGIGAGCESMTMGKMQDLANPETLSDKIFENDVAQNCLIPMGITSEILSEKFKLQRKKLDEFALESQRRAAKARKEGLFKNEIVPIKVVHINPKTKEEKEILLEHDDGIRENTTLEKLSSLTPAFKRDGLSTGGNSSQVTDGAAAVLLMTRKKANQLGLKILGKIVAHCVVGVPPEIMGVGPAYAIPKVLEKCNLSKDDIDIYEINEAFASQATYCIDKLGLDYNKVNPKGGAIALGHPLGTTGARQVATLLHELIRTKKKLGVISMCMGTGMGAAAVFEAEFQLI